MTGARRRVDDAQMRAFAFALAFMALGNLIVLGCAISWLRTLPGDSASRAIALCIAAAASNVISGMFAMLAWSWAR